MKVGVIGVGLAGSSHLFDLVSDPRFDVVAVCSRRAERAAYAAEIFGVPSHWTDPAELLTAGFLDGVVIATPPAAATGLLRLALSQMLLVLVDKPVAERARDLRQVIADPACEIEHAVVGYNRRYQGHVHHVRDWIAAAPSDAIDVVECHWSGPFSARYVNDETYRRQASLGHGVLLDNGSHIFDTLSFLGFGPLTVTGAALQCGESGAEVAAKISLATRTCASVIANITDGGLTDEWSIRLSGAGIDLELTRFGASGWWLGEHLGVPCDELLRPVEDLLRLANSERTLGASLTDALNVLELVEAARSAAGVSDDVARG
ncbi:Gfo/Idh/MocA family protein [Terracoccus luteus]|uniref:Putative dehydrogenase n=1 Tax=Terracoccus luteus TaxID=53356 RepID=A0A839Q0N3_9MICO|nr:Gfo/Idh/MocA family oxidoreductase [Terracoccus luteus]MBB2988524.1 putative dehydrogenase [Terracoccus luteus]MCP2174174.1 putative dehydrogenase [Terracoccus luteus]